MSATDEGEIPITELELSPIVAKIKFVFIRQDKHVTIIKTYYGGTMEEIVDYQELFVDQMRQHGYLLHSCNLLSLLKRTEKWPQPPQS